MKAKFVCCALLFIFMFSISAFALNGTAKVSLTAPAQIAGKHLAPGDYRLTWTGDANNVQVTFTSFDKKTVVVATAKIVEGPKAQENAIIKGDDDSVKEIWFSGKTATLVF